PARIAADAEKATITPYANESATISAFCRKLPQVCQARGKFPDYQSNRLKSLFTCAYYIILGCRSQCQQKSLSEIAFNKLGTMLMTYSATQFNYPNFILNAPIAEAAIGAFLLA
ncbi:MAG: hypothetical protein IJP27_08350, partial [Clostridia bacterium]|nr:hypothetical protein [Clostridia bacterium]